jgi:hypothetical protein
MGLLGKDRHLKFFWGLCVLFPLVFPIRFQRVFSMVPQFVFMSTAFVLRSHSLCFMKSSLSCSLSSHFLLHMFLVYISYVFVNCAHFLPSVLKCPDVNPTSPNSYPIFLAQCLTLLANGPDGKPVYS